MEVSKELLKNKNILGLKVGRCIKRVINPQISQLTKEHLVKIGSIRLRKKRKEEDVTYEVKKAKVFP